MAKTNQLKKRKVSKKPTKNVNKKIKTTKKSQKVLPSPNATSIPNTFSDSDSDSESIEKFLEPYSKDQLIDLVTNFAVEDASLCALIREAADRDISHRKIFVFGLGWDTTHETVLKAFESYGEIEDCHVVMDRATGKAKGFAFVTLKYRKGAIKALKQPRKVIGNRVVSCQLASLGNLASQQSSDAASRKIYVSNVHKDADAEKLRILFAKFGEIEMGPIGFDIQTGKSRGYALFIYKTQDGARKALEEPYKMFDGHQLHCQKAAEGKNKAVAAAMQYPVANLQAAPGLAVAQNMNMMLAGQQMSLQALYGGLVANPNAGLINPMLAAGMSQVGQVAGSGGLGGYAVVPQNLGNMGGSTSMLGYGSSGQALSLQQQPYPNAQIGSATLAARSQGASGATGGYPSLMCVDSSFFNTSAPASPASVKHSRGKETSRNRGACGDDQDRGNGCEAGTRCYKLSQPIEIVSSSRPKSSLSNIPQNSVCRRCGCDGHWSRTCRTPKHLVEAYKLVQKTKNEEHILESHHVDQPEADKN